MFRPAIDLFSMLGKSSIEALASQSELANADSFVLLKVGLGLVRDVKSSRDKMTFSVA